MELPHGIPSHDTFGRVFARLDSQPLEGCFTLWVQSLAAALRVQVVTVDGKEARRAHDAGQGGRPYTWSALRRTRHVWS
ncbi:MAG: transposase family protein [Caldilineaceae bacterium SB0666_bin_21]|nr:transposase family protein [Caldilineaceae bacterium SB0666_bin_21]